MEKKVWIFQYKKDLQRVGAQRASWYVGWYDQRNKRHAESCGPGSAGKKKADRRLRRIQSELDMRVHQPRGNKRWSQFRMEYETEFYPGLAPRSVVQVKAALNHFERISKPGLMESINAHTIDSFVSARRQERGKKPGSTLSPATINKDLRHIKAALKIAAEWGYLANVPKIRMVREPEKLICFVTPEHFQLIYKRATPLARMPVIPGQPYDASAWWEALVATCYMTGWRIGELLALRTEDVDLKASTVITRYQDNKGSRDELVPVHPVVMEHLKHLLADHSHVFQWPHDEKTLWTEFGRIQREAGIKLTCRENHEHTLACHVYGFHDLRRAFATVNAKQMKAETLQKIMRHKSYKTTLSYVNLSEQVEEAVSQMPVPEVLRKDEETEDPS